MAQGFPFSGRTARNTEIHARVGLFPGRSGGDEIIGHPLADSWSPWAYWKGGLAYWLVGLEELKIWEERAENGHEPKPK